MESRRAGGGSGDNGKTEDEKRKNSDYLGVDLGTTGCCS